jgi:hypothetical protein
MTHSGTVHADVAQVRKLWRVDADNVRWFDALILGNGTVHTLDARPYITHLTDFGIPFTAPYCGVGVTAPPIAATADLERESKLDAERVTLQFRQASTRRLDAGRRPITESPLFGGPAQTELF